MIRTTGTTKDNAMGPPPNPSVDQISIGVVSIENGKAVKHWMFFDPKEMMTMKKLVTEKSKN